MEDYINGICPACGKCNSEVTEENDFGMTREIVVYCKVCCKTVVATYKLVYVEVKL